MDKKSIVLLTVISIATLLTAVVGTTFAYFSTTVKKDIAGSANQAVVETAKYTASTITFAATGNKIELLDAIPGDTKTATFTIANSGNTDIPFNIIWNNVTSTFGESDPDATDSVGVTNPEKNLVYSLSCTGGVALTKNETVMPLTSSDANAKIATDVTIGAGKTATCDITVLFKNLDETQNYNQGRSLTGYVDVTVNNISK